MTTPISPGALRAAKKIMNSVDMPTFERGPEVFAAIIDESTGLPELLEALKEVNEIAWSDGTDDSPSTKLRFIARLTDAQIKKSEGTI